MGEHDMNSVAHVLWSGNVGGIGRLVTDLATEQARQGLRVTLAFGQVRGPFAESAQTPDARVVDLALASGYDLRPSRARRGAAALHDVDVIHLHAFNPALAAPSLLARRPVVFTEHGNFGLGRKLGAMEQTKRRLQGVFLRRSVCSIAANSRHSADYLCALYGIHRPSVTVVHNGIPLNGSRSSIGGTPTRGSLRVTFVGRLTPAKRVDRAIRALGEAARGDEIHLDIVGTGPLESDLRALAGSLGLRDRVEFHGYCSDVAALLSASDVLLHPSEGEGFGLAILEGCAVGALPIVFADGGGALEVLPPEGIVVRTVEDLAGALDGLIGSTAVSSDARSRRQAWVRERFPISRTATSYLELYRAALQRAPR